MNIDKCWYKNKCINECKESCIRYNTIKTLYSLSTLPESLWEHKQLICEKYKGDKEAFVRLSTIEKDIKNFVTNGNNLYIYSKTCGNGKTSWGIRLMESYFDKVWDIAGFNCKALFVSVSQLLYKCKQSISRNVNGLEDLLNKIENVDLVIWDDLMCQKFTDYEHQIVFQYIDNRINAKKSNIYTGNFNREDSIGMMGEKMTSRIFGTSEVIEFIENDKRGMK